MSDIFKSTPMKGAVTRDLTDKTLILDIKNALGEKFHFKSRQFARVKELYCRRDTETQVGARSANLTSLYLSNR